MGNVVHRIQNGPTWPATDQQLVMALIAFANGQDVELVQMPEGRVREPGGERTELRAEFSRFLAQAVEGRLGKDFLRDVGLPLLKSLQGGGPAIEFGDRGFALAYFCDFPTLRSALRYALLLLLALNKPYGAALSRCQLERCGVFYLARRNPNGGPANRHYCTPDHRTEAHNLKQNRKLPRKKPRKPK